MFMKSLRGRSVFISVLTLGELRKGAERTRREDARGGARLDAWIEEVEEEYSEMILDVNQVVAEIWGRLSSLRPRPVVDALLAATALAHDLTLLTRNVRDFADTGVAIVNPWQ
jgi:predicted nucleic acid-binding protein